MEGNKRRIKIKGKASVSVAPDTIEVSMGVEAKDPSYDKAMEKARQALEDIRKALAKEELEKEDIKTRSFSVESDYENVRNNKGDYIRKFVGYRISNRLRLELDQDPEKLGRVLTALANSKVDPEITIIYKVKDRKEFEDQVLEEAIKDAKSKAEVIAKASDLELLNIVSINYGGGEEGNQNQAVHFSRAMPLASSEIIDLEAENLTFSDSVIMEWEIG